MNPHSETHHNRLLGLMGAIKGHHASAAQKMDASPEPELKVTLTVENSECVKKVVTITEPGTFLFGRAMDAFLVLPKDDRFASRNHFVLVVSPQDCRLIDLDSANGTFVGSMRYGGNTPLPPGTTKSPNDVKEKEIASGDLIQAGETKVRVEISPCDPSSHLALAKTRILAVEEILGSCGDSGDSEVSKRRPGSSETTVEQPPTAWFPLRAQFRNASGDVANFSPPLELKGYRFERLIGKGRTGYVFKAFHEASGLPVAVKVLSVGQRPLRGDRIPAFQRALATQAQLSHPNIVKFLNVREAEQPCLLFEYIDGIDLGRFLAARGGRLGLEEAGPIMIDILSGLAYAHAFSPQSGKKQGGLPEGEGGIVHRGLKLENILLSHSGERWIAKVSDFGLVKSFESLGITGNTTGELMAGSPHYWPREFITGYRYLLPASDVFSAAAIFFQMLTGEFVRQGFSTLLGSGKQDDKPDALDYVKVIMNESTLPMLGIAPDLPEQLCNTIDKALTERELSREPTQMRNQLNALRFAHAGAFLQALRKLGLPESDRCDLY